MESYSSIDFFDVSLIQQNSWVVVLQKQLNRNCYLFKQYQQNTDGQKYKFNYKNLLNKIKQDVKNEIVNHIKNKKIVDKNKTSQTIISTIQRRNTEECIIKNVSKQNLKTNSSSATNFTSSKYNLNQKLNISLNQQESIDDKILPFQQYDNKNRRITQASEQAFKRYQKNLVINKTHQKPILSLHDLEFSYLELKTSGNKLKKTFMGLSKSPKKYSAKIKLHIECKIQGLKDKIQRKSLIELPEIQNRRCTSKFAPAPDATRILRYQSEVKKSNAHNSQWVMTNVKKSHEIKDYGTQLQVEKVSLGSFRLKHTKIKNLGFDDNHIKKINNSNLVPKMRSVKLPIC